MTALSKVISCRAAKGEVRTWPARERQSMRLPGRCRPVPQDAPEGGARVLVGLAVFKTADGPHGSWWVRFPLPSATFSLIYQGLSQIRPNCLNFVSVLASEPGQSHHRCRGKLLISGERRARSSPSMPDRSRGGDRIALSRLRTPP